MERVKDEKKKIEDYKFKKMKKKIGVESIDGRELVIEEIKGMIEGEREGVGIGESFIGNVESKRVMMNMVYEKEEDVEKEYKVIRGEMEDYEKGIEEKKEIVEM